MFISFKFPLEIRLKLLETGFNGDSGGQVKFNLTKELEDGFLRFYFKQLDDKVTTYLPSPVLVESNGSFGAVAGYDASSQTLHSQQTANITTYDPYGNAMERSVSDGIESKVDAFGFEFDKEVGDGWTVNNKFRRSSITGGFISPFTDGFAGGTQSITGKGAALCADATIDGQALDCSNVTATIDGVSAPGDQLAFTNLLFDTSFNDVGLLVNDLSVSKTFENINFDAGIYYSKQNIDISWNRWHTRMQTLDTIDEELLQRIARITGGQYFRATDNESLVQIYESIDQLEKSEIEGFEFYRYTEHFSIFLYLALACIGLELLLNFVLLKTAF